MIPRFYYTFPINFYVKTLFYRKKTITHFLGSNNFYYINTARTGLRLLLSSITNNKLRVGVQVFTCNTVFHAIKNAGHEIVFLDITEDFKLNLEFLREKKDKIDVLIVTHTFGNAERFDEIRNIIGKNKIIIEDCAHAYLSKYNGVYCGTLGDASIFSFGLGKFPPIGTGGGVIINSPEKFPLFNDKYNLLKNESFIKEVIIWIKLLFYSIVMKRPLYGIFTRKLGKLLDNKFDFIDKFSFKESKGSRIGLKLLSNSNFQISKLLEINKNNLKEFISNYHKEINIKDYNAYIFPLLLEERDKVYNIFLSNGVEVVKHFENSLVWAINFGYEKNCPCAESIAKKILTIPLHKAVKKNEIVKISNLLTKISEQK